MKMVRCCGYVEMFPRFFAALQDLDLALLIYNAMADKTGLQWNTRKKATRACACCSSCRACAPSGLPGQVRAFIEKARAELREQRQIRKDRLKETTKMPYRFLALNTDAKVSTLAGA